VPRPSVLLVTVIVLTTSSGCAGDGDDGAAGRTMTRTTPPAVPEVFTGTVDSFYVVPDPLPPGAPGDLIRVQEVGTDAGIRTLRVMYHSRDAEDRDRAVTGIVSHPIGAAPEGGWPVQSWAHGTAGLASTCAPSRAGDDAPDFGIGGVRVATDYVGLGPEGELHPYLSRASEGNSVIDGVRAARQLPGVDAGREWFAVGHSQGGHAALAAHELAADHAPELELVATVSYAPGFDLDRTFGGSDEIVARVLTAMALYGAASEHPAIEPADYVGPELAAVADVITTGCHEILAAVAGIPAESFWRQPPLDTEPARSLLLANEVGDVAAEAPVLLVAGSADDLVVLPRVQSLFERMCEAGQVTELVVVDGGDHASIIDDTADRVERWLRDRLDGLAPTDSCA
jgi:pimeloyl-ACP methyl ester carboxylesterase